MAEHRCFAKDREFKEQLHENLRDRLVCGVNDPVIQKRLLSEEKVMFRKPKNIAQGLQSVAKDVQTLQGSTAEIWQSSGIHILKDTCLKCGKTDHISENCKFKYAVCKKKVYLKSLCFSLKRVDQYHSTAQPSSTKPLSRSSTQPSYPSSISPRSSKVSSVKTLSEDSELNELNTLFKSTSLSSRLPLYTTVSIDNQALTCTMEVDTGASYSVKLT